MAAEGGGCAAVRWDLRLTAERYAQKRSRHHGQQSGVEDEHGRVYTGGTMTEACAPGALTAALGRPEGQWKADCRAIAQWISEGLASVKFSRAAGQGAGEGQQAEQIGLAEVLVFRVLGFRVLGFRV